MAPVPRLIALIDIGSNTVRMALYNIADNSMEMVLKKKDPLGLAACIEDGALTRDGVEQLIKVLENYQAFLVSFDIRAVTAFTTAALRNAANSEAVLCEVTERTGIAVRVLTGEEEATYDFIGAIHDLTEPDGVLFDVGGASTEVIIYRDREMAEKISLPLGSLSLRKEFVKDILPTAAEVAAMLERAKAVTAALTPLDAPLIVGIGGTMKSAAALYRQLYHNNPNVPMLTEKLPDIIGRFTRDRAGGLDPKDRLAIFRSVPDRLHTIIPGLTIVAALVEKFGAQSLVYSDSGVREGYIYQEIMG